MTAAFRSSHLLGNMSILCKVRFYV